MPPKSGGSSLTPRQLRARLNSRNIDEAQFLEITGASRRQLDSWLTRERAIPAWVPVFIDLIGPPTGGPLKHQLHKPQRRPDNVEFRDRLAKADISQVGFSIFTGMSLRAVQSWCSGERPLPPWVFPMLDLLIASPHLLSQCLDRRSRPQN